ncbi:hypothetical protein SK128_017438 [Halocaridina rubra]|uniref:Uncharacterized protein n=1 Tax=Halocaridina rubra TaxID=373956 RepID=A0AAN9FU53_HALRR
MLRYHQGELRFNPCTNCEENTDNQRPDDTTETPTTTTRRPFPGLLGHRRPFLPPRRPIVRPDESTSRRPFQPFRPTGDRPIRPFTSTSPATTDENVPEDEVSAENTPNIPFATRKHPSTRPAFIPPRRPTPTTKETTSTSTTTTTTTRKPPPLTTTPRPTISDDTKNFLLQDVPGLLKPQNTPPVRFTQIGTAPKPIIPFKLSTALPEIPAAVRDQFPLNTDPVLASGLFKLSGCNIYGRMYDIGDSIKELSATCKECRCTPLGVQCLPKC